MEILDFKNLNPSHLDLSLSDNLWICDGKLAWIKIRSDFVREKSIRCFMLPVFKGHTIDEIPLEILVKVGKESPINLDLNKMSFKDKIIGIIVSICCMFLFLLLLFFGYRNRWCTKSDYWENNKAQFTKTEIDADEESEICMIYIDEADKSDVVSA